MPGLPNQAQINIAAGSQWVQTYALTNDDGTPMDLAGATFELVIRPNASNASEPAMVAVNSTAATAQGYMTVDLDASTVQVVLSPTATALLGQSASAYALWLDQGQADATALVVGTAFSTLIAAA